MKYFLGLLAVPVTFIAFGFGLHFFEENILGGRIYALAIISVLVGLLVYSCLSLRGKLKSNQSALKVLSQTFILHIRWTFAEPARIGSSAEELLREQTEAMFIAINGKAKAHLRKSLIKMIDTEIGRVGREESGNAAQLRFLKKVEDRLKQANEYGSDPGRRN